MIIKVYKSISDPRVMNKELTFIRQYDITYKENLDSIDTSILLKTSEIDFNYIEFVDAKRFYFITNTEIESKDRARVYLHCDVLSTHKEYIKQCHGLVIKGGEINPYFSPYDTESRKDIHRYEFENKFNIDGQYILATITTNIDEVV